MGKTITLTPRTVAITNTKSGTTPFDTKWDPTLSTTLTEGSDETFGEGEFDGGTTTETQYIDTITDDLVIKYGPATLAINVESVTFTDDTESIELPGTRQTAVTVLPTDATVKTVTYASSDEAVATVDEDGLVTAVGVGTCTITATTTDQSKTDTAAVTVTDDA